MDFEIAVPNFACDKWNTSLADVIRQFSFSFARKTVANLKSCNCVTLRRFFVIWPKFVVAVTRELFGLKWVCGDGVSNWCLLKCRWGNHGSGKCRCSNIVNRLNLHIFNCTNEHECRQSLQSRELIAIMIQEINILSGVYIDSIIIIIIITANLLELFTSENSNEIKLSSQIYLMQSPLIYKFLCTILCLLLTAITLFAQKVTPILVRIEIDTKWTSLRVNLDIALSQHSLTISEHRRL